MQTLTITHPSVTIPVAGMYGIEQDEGDQLLFDFAKTIDYSVYINGKLMIAKVVMNTVIMGVPVYQQGQK
jgi:hypothetical protein